VVQELLIERAASRGLVGDVYMAAYRACFPACNRPSSTSASIARRSCTSRHLGAAKGERGARQADREILTEGQSIMVQVIKDPIGTKGARLSTQVSIAGRLLVYLPQDPHIGISQRIESEGGRQMLRRADEGAPPRRREGGLHHAHACRGRHR